VIEVTLWAAPGLQYAFIMSTDSTPFRAPNVVDRAFNRTFGFLVGLGLGFHYSYLLEVRGRKTGRLFSTPINLLDQNGKSFLVAPRGQTQWVKNAEAAGQVTLKRGRTRLKFRLIPVPDAQKPEILKAYLDQFAFAVQKFFPIPAGSSADAFRPIAANYPVFELVPSEYAP
jgi:deazaflavin-dependent oxidoreductase (nitroreductase family)